MIAIRTIDLTRRFGGVKAVDGVSITIPAGQIRGLIGPNGAGKTTLLNVLSGVDRASGGRYELFEQNATRWSLHRTVHRAGALRTFQTVRLFETMTVFDNVVVAAGATGPREGRLRRRSHRTALARAEAAIERLGLAGHAGSMVRQLSYGTRRSVEVAQALVGDTRLLLLDEPAAGLNSAEREELGRLLVRLRSDGMTVVLVEHQMDLVSAVCDELTVMDFGRVIAEGPPATVIADERVLEAYIGEAHDHA